MICDGERVGSFGKLANSVAGELKLPKDSKANNQIYLGEVDFAALSAHMPEGLRYKPISEYDIVTRDLAVVVDEKVSCGSLTNEIKKACKQVGDVELFGAFLHCNFRRRPRLAFLTFRPLDTRCPFFPAISFWFHRTDWTGWTLDGYVGAAGSAPIAAVSGLII